MVNKPISIFQFLWKIIKPYRWWYALMLQAPLMTAFYVVVNNYSLKLVIDAFSLDLPHQYQHLVFPVLLFILAQIGLDVVWRLSNIAEWHAEPYARRAILLNAYDHIQHHSYSYFQNNPAGTLISKLKGILDGYDKVFSSLHHHLGKNFCIVTISVFFLLMVNTTVFLFLIIWCVLVTVIMLPMGVKLNEYSNKVAESKHQIIGNFTDNITNIFSLFYFAKRKTELNKAREFMAKHYIPDQITMYKYDFKFSLLGSLLYWFMLISVFLFMVYLRQQGTISTGEFIYVMMTALAISFELWLFITGLCDFMKAMGDFKSSLSILSPHEQIDNPGVVDYQIVKGNIDIIDLSFAYNDNQFIFKNLNLSIKAGEKIGIVGHSGAGKSTLISLLLKNFNPADGTLLFDGKSLEEISSDSLRSQISLIPQDIILFHRSIAENIGYAKDNVTLAEIKAAAKMANIDDFIEQLPQKYDTLVGERGIKISGGQRQRIAIARAVIKKAPIVIFDEATSSLDSAAEQQIQQSINAMLDQSKATVIAIAHRLSTIKHMDRILVMDKGKIVEQGNFNELIAKEKGYFSKLWQTQVNGMVV